MNLEQEVSQREATARDLARSVELNQQYLDLLDEILDSDMAVDSGVTVRADNTTIRFPDDDSLVAWIMRNSQ